MAEEFKLGDPVWAKMKGFPPWPGKVVNPPDKIKTPSKKNSHCIYFFGSENYAFIEDQNIKSFNKYKEQLMKSNKSGQFKNAVLQAQKYMENGCQDQSEFRTNAEVEFERLQQDMNHLERKKKVPGKVMKRSSNDTTHISVKKPRKSTNSESSPNSFRSHSPLTNHSPAKHVSSLLDRPTQVNRPDTPPLDVENVSRTLKEKNIQPSTLKFGFMGLGVMGAGVVKNLLNSGHTVMVWNRSSEKCRDFVKAGAEQGLTPSDVISGSDITFSCVSDPQVCKDIVFGNCGVLQEISAGKGYIEMTGIDAETSQDISEAITSKGGRYLEAQVQGSKCQSEEGTLVILAAGDRSLFDDCQSCFQAMGKSSFYLGEVGNASKMNLVLQLMSGVTLAGLAEGMALADRAGLQQKDVMEVLDLTSLACPILLEKGSAIIEGGFPTHLALQHMQKDLKLSLSLGDQLEQPLPLAATANEVFKHAKRLGYGEHDVSAVYIRARF